MVFKLLRKFNVFNYLSGNDKNRSTPTIDLTDVDDQSILLSVPLYFYVDFIRTYYKSLLLFFIPVLAILFTYIYTPETYLVKSVPKLPWAKPGVESTDDTYIQTYSPLIYEEMLKSLRKMQQAAVSLQMKQQASDRKTLALLHQVRTLEKKTNIYPGILNEEKAQEMIKEALLVYDADKLGLRDYALENFGATIVSTSSTIPVLTEKRYTFFGLLSFRTYSNPRIIIHPNFEPGNCFAFEGSYAKIRIKLSNEIYVSAVTLEHASRNLLTPEEIQATPKTFAIHGVLTDNSEIGFPLGQFSYALEGPPRQTFLITGKEVKSFLYIDFEVLNNYGNKDYTCVYRLRIHGRLVDNN